MKTMKKYDLSALLPKASEMDALSRFFIQETAELEKQVVAKNWTLQLDTLYEQLTDELHKIASGRYKMKLVHVDLCADWLDAAEMYCKRFEKTPDPITHTAVKVTRELLTVFNDQIVVRRNTLKILG